MRALASVAAVTGLGCFAALLWAAVTRMDRWEVRSFVLLYWAAVVCALVSQLGRGPWRPAPFIRDARRMLTTGVLALAVWFWVPGAAPAVFWAARRVSALLL